MTRISSAALTGLAVLLGSFGIALQAQAGDTAFYDSQLGTPYGFAPGEENATMDPSYRDEKSNRLMVTGYAEGLSPSSGSYSSDGSGSYYSSNSGVQSATAGGVSGNGSYGSAQAIGNNLTIITNGSYNTVFVDATQINNGNQSANVSLNGGQ